MYDSVSAADLPADAEMVAGYVDGLYAWSPAEWAMHPRAVQVQIATQPGTDAGDVLDCETGDATAQQCPAWIRMRQEAGYLRPTVYCALSAVTLVRQLCSGLEFDLWVADWTGMPHVIAGAAAVQYANPRQSGGHYDLSLVADDGWPHRTTPPVTGGSIMGYMAPGPPATEADFIARRIKIHEWHHLPGAGTGTGWPAAAEMDRLLQIWVEKGAEAVFGDIFGA